VEANGIPQAPLEARRPLRVGLVRDIFDTVTRSKECILNNFQLSASHIEPLFNTRHLGRRYFVPMPANARLVCQARPRVKLSDSWFTPRREGARESGLGTLVGSVAIPSSRSTTGGKRTAR
jgi:hypothetical protein